MRLIITRPVEDSVKLTAVLQAAGHDVLAAPLIEIVARVGVALTGGPYQAVALSSANAARALVRSEIADGGEASLLPLSAAMSRGRPEASPPNARQALELSELLRLPAFTPGEQSAAAARAAGFACVTACGGDITAVARIMIATLDPARGPVLYLSGAEIAGDLATEPVIELVVRVAVERPATLDQLRLVGRAEGRSRPSLALHPKQHSVSLVTGPRPNVQL